MVIAMCVSAPNDHGQRWHFIWALSHLSNVLNDHPRWQLNGCAIGGKKGGMGRPNNQN